LLSRLKIFSGAILLFFGIVSCEPQTETVKAPDNLLSEEKMADVVAALHLSDAMIIQNNMSIAEKKKDLKFNVFKENNVKREDYYNSMKYYCQSPDQLKIIYQLAMDKLNAMKK
jgi:hypothetical protein